MKEKKKKTRKNRFLFVEQISFEAELHIELDFNKLGDFQNWSNENLESSSQILNLLLTR